MKEAKKLAFFLPNIFTALNMGCGFGAILLSYQGKFYLAVILLLLGGIFDLVDGRIARILGVESSFGENFDSISDVVTFGVAPAILAYNCFFVNSGRLGQVVAFLYLLCGALRLARFNANIDKVSSEYFQGLPIPGAAIAIGGYVLISIIVPEIRNYPYVAMGYLIFYSLLMISNIPFFSFKKSEWSRRHRKLVLVLIFLIIALLVTYVQIMVFAGITIYVIGCFIYFFTHKGELKDVFQWKSEGEG